jgi:hypothetical protein
VVHVGEGAVLRVDGLVVGDVVAEVHLGRRIHRRNPDGVDAEVLEIGQALGDAVQVADAIAVRVLEGAGIDLIEDGVLPPGGVGRRCCGLVECGGIRCRRLRRAERGQE